MTPYSGNNAGPLNTSLNILDTTDLALGGSTGNLNVGTKGLLDNDNYLYKVMGGFEHLNTFNVSSGATVNLTVANLLRSLVSLFNDTNNYFTGVLPQASTYQTGGVAVIRRLKSGSITKPVTLTCFSGDTFIDINNATPTSIYLHNGEWVVLVNTGSKWLIQHFEGNYYNSGDQMLGYIVKPGTIKRDGTVYNRADYPRLWAWVNANGLATSDATWLSDPGSTGFFKFKSLFSSGDGSTTFRVPDDTGLFDRAMTYAAGRDADRVTAGTGGNVGDLQADAFKLHTHGYVAESLSGGSGLASGTGGVSGAATSDPTGGSETRPVNVAKHPLLVY